MVNGFTQLAVGGISSITVTIAMQVFVLLFSPVTVKVTEFDPKLEQSKFDLSILRVTLSAVASPS